MPALHAFIDTNIFLNFYSFPEDKSAVLDELIYFLGVEMINLHLPKQVEDEFWRNRESKIHAAVMEFKNASLPTAVPNHMRGTETAKQYHEAIQSADSSRKKLIANVLGLAVLQKLEIDIQIGGVFSGSIRHADCQETLTRAVARMHKGNPPGKPGNIGDRYNWEMLLSKAPDQDLYIVTKDGDFTSSLGSLEKTIRPMGFLAQEWSIKAAGKSIYIYSSIQALLDHYKMLAAQPENDPPHVEVVAPDAPAIPAVPIAPPAPPPAQGGNGAFNNAMDAAKSEAIEALIRSESFHQTHLAVASLAQMADQLTVADAEKLFQGALDNQQINWIISDTDVNSFFVKLLNDHFVAAEGGLVDAMIDLLGLKADDEAAGDHYD